MSRDPEGDFFKEDFLSSYMPNCISLHRCGLNKCIFFKHNISMKLYTDFDPLGQISGHIY